MKIKKLSVSFRKYIRKEKARIHRGVFDFKEQEKLINELYQKILKPYDNSRNIQSGNK